MAFIDNLSRIRQKISDSAKAAGRNPETIKLLAVSKTVPAEGLLTAYHAGQKAFGENRVQEWMEKSPVLPEDCQWHLVGRLQTNKVKYLNPRISLIHSLDRLELLTKLEEQGKKINHTFSTLVQVNIARDQSKAGLERAELRDFLQVIGDYPHVTVRGLMTIGALNATEDETRGFFRELRELRDEMDGYGWPGVDLKELSMGMSQDFTLAIAEGATIVRIGRQLFGERPNGLGI